MFIISYLIFYLDNFNFYLNRLIKRLQIIYFFILLLLTLIALNTTNFLDFTCYIKDDNLLNPIDNNICIKNKSIQSLLSKLLLIYYICIAIVFCIIMQVGLKLHSVNNIKLNYSIINVKISDNLEFYLNRIIFYFKYTNIICIWLILLILALNFSTYTLNEQDNNNYLVVANNNVKESVMILFFTYKWMYNNIKVKKKHYFTSSNDILSIFLTENKLKPIYTYEKLHTHEIRNTILKDLSNLSGIYLIFNKLTGDYYIGSASTGKFYSRFSNHLLYLKGNKILKHAVKKYGLENFTFLVLELFPEVVNKENNKKLLDMEDFYLKSLLPNYNILTEAGSSFGYKHTELTRIKMKSNYSAYRRKLIGDLNKSKNLSEDTRNKMKEKALKKGIVSFSKENMRKISKPVILYNLDRTVFGEYSSIKEAAKSVNCSEKTIYRALKTDKKLLKRRFIINLKKKFLTLI